MIELDAERMKWYETVDGDLVNLDHFYKITIEFEEDQSEFRLIVGYTTFGQRIVLDHSTVAHVSRHIEELRCRLERIQNN